jgi:hypothetical protein
MREASAVRAETGFHVDSTSYVRFIILTSARTGSTMLGQALNSSPNIICFREIFNPLIDFVDFHVDGYDDSSAEDRALRDQDCKRFLQERIFRQHPIEIRAIGFKMHYFHFIGFPGLRERLVEDTELRVLHVRRRNLLRALVSTRMAQRTGVWAQYRKAPPPNMFTPANALRAARHPLKAANWLRRYLRPKEPSWKALRAPVVLSEAECEEFFTQPQRHSAYYGGLFDEHPQLTLYYEDLLDDHKDVFNQVQSFLGLKPRQLSVSTRRQNPEPLRELVANYDELYAVFKNTPEAAFFD